MDEVPENAGRADSLPAPVGTARVVDGTHADSTSRDSSPAFSLPIAVIIPRGWWNYLLGAMACVSLGSGLLVAGWCAPDWSPSLGPGIGRLFAFPGAPAAKWFSSLLLAISAQLALLIWWARSQSQNDFDGRYWLWIRVSGVWLVFSGCVETEAHQALCETIWHFWPRLAGARMVLGWLVPASALGVWIVAVLAREMRDCRWSRGFLFLAAGWYLIAAWLRLELAIPFSREVCSLLSEGSMLGGHVGLFLSMWVHARHVVHCTPDPAARPRSSWRIPRPHFHLPALRLPSFRLPAFGREPEPPREPQPALDRPTSKRKPAAKSINANPEPAGKSAPAAEKPAPATKPHFRFDGQHSLSPEKVGQPPKIGGDALDELESNPVELADPATCNRTEQALDGDQPDDRDGESDELPSKPDLRGLSKKQRRRLLQEYRERAANGG
jgi:hypothetical protein